VEKLLQPLELVYVLVLKDLKVRYKSSFFGYMWALANPFAFALVYYIAFKLIMRVQMPNYSIFLLTAMFPWVWMSNSIIQATSGYRNNASLVKKIRINTLILPFANVAHELVHFCFALPVLMVFILVAGGKLYLEWLWQIPLMVFLQFSVVYPLGLLLALSNVFVRDVEYLVGIFMSMLFFLTPIVYPLTMVPEIYRNYFEWSPFSAIILNWRNVLMNGQIEWPPMIYCVVLSVVLLFIASIVHERTRYKLAELL